MNKFPIKMILQENSNDTPREVDVYDFIHDINDTFQTLALCWIPKSRAWITVPIVCVSPQEDEKLTRQILNEEVTNK